MKQFKGILLIFFIVCIFLLGCGQEEKTPSEKYLQEQVLIYSSGNIPQDKIKEYYKMRDDEKEDKLYFLIFIISLMLGNVVYAGFLLNKKIES